MKVNIKGLVFTGFAAAILSANAMAAGENIVTSKSYVDAKISNAENISNTSTTTAPNEKQVYDALANKQINQGSVNKYQVSKNGGWVDANGAVSVTPASGTAYLTMDTSAGDGSVTLNVIATTDGTFAHVDDLVNEGGTADANKLPTAAAVKAYVDSVASDVAQSQTYTADEETVHLDTSNGRNEFRAITHAIDSNAEDELAKAADVYTALTGKQNVDNGTKYKVSKEGAWQDLNSAVGTTDSNHISITANDSTGALTINAVTSSVSSGATGLVTAGDVYTYMTGNQADWAQTNTSAPDYIENKPTIVTDGSDISTASSADTTVLPTAFAVQEYADAKVSSSASISSTSTTTAPNESAVYSELATKENVSNKINTIDGNSDSAHYPSAAAVYNYVQSQTGGTVIPGKAALCNTYPCALVNDSTGAHWRTMATDSHNGGVLADYCDANNSCSVGNCTDSRCVEGA